MGRAVVNHSFHVFAVLHTGELITDERMSREDALACFRRCVNNPAMTYVHLGKVDANGLERINYWSIKNGIKHPMGA
jgi:hypothetical protein